MLLFLSPIGFARAAHFDQTTAYPFAVEGRRTSIEIPQTRSRTTLGRTPDHLKTAKEKAAGQTGEGCGTPPAAGNGDLDSFRSSRLSSCGIQLCEMIFATPGPVTGPSPASQSDLGREFSSGVTGQPDTAVRRRVIRDHAFVHAEIEAAQPHKIRHVHFVNGGTMIPLLIGDDWHSPRRVE